MNLKDRRKWPSKIGTMPGGMIVVKGYPSSDPPVGAVVHYKELEYSPKGQVRYWVNQYAPWQRGTVTRYTESGIICIDRM